MAKTPNKKEEKAVTNGSENGAEAQVAPALSVLAQYTKDFSFESPNAPNSLRPRDKAPDIQININVNPTPLSESDFEVELKLEARAVDGDEVLFNVELVYAGIFRVTGIPQEALQPIVLVECPRILFPFARQIVADATRNGNFPPLMIDPVDFAQLYQAKMAEAGATEEKKSS